jgi:hypothetical protein
VLQVYVRNPVGISVFSSSTVGGKPYLFFAITAIVATSLCFLRVPEKEIRMIFYVSIIGGLMNMAVSVIGKFVPIVAYYTGGSYVRTDVVDYTNMNVIVDEGAATRNGSLVTVGKNLSLWISSYKSPLRDCFNPFWGGLIIFSLVAVMLGGYRNGIVSLSLTYLVSIAYRSGLSGILLSSIGGATIICLLAFVNLISPLPPNMQRSLSFLPGTWQERYKADASGSTEWRVEIWKEALFSERWIQNKIMGDGLGFSAAELAAQLNANAGMRRGVSGFDAHREAILANGDYHSGPVSMVRTIGYVGLILFLIAQIRVAVHAHREIMRCKNTSWYPIALFVGIPIIWAPIFFLFVFGDFKADMLSLLMNIGMVRLLQNNLPLPRYVAVKRGNYVPLIAQESRKMAYSN